MSEGRTNTPPRLPEWLKPGIWVRSKSQPYLGRAFVMFVNEENCEGGFVYHLEQPYCSNQRLYPGWTTGGTVFASGLDGWEPCVAQSESAPIPGAKLAMRLKQQRDECAEALRGLVAVVESNFPMPAGVHPGSPLDKARKALADVPTYEQQLRNIFAGMADEK